MVQNKILFGDENMSKIKIMVATHKPYKMPEDKVYYPVHVGAEGKDEIGYVLDNKGDNISAKNANYCELTGLYYMWKNEDYDVLGVAHYRRYFINKKRKGEKWDKILQGKEVASIMKHTDIVLPKKRNYFIETNYSQYVHAHHAEDLDTTREIISEMYPDYIAAYDRSMKETKGHRFNMFIMKKDKADEYIKWMFDILFELEKRLDISNYSVNDARVFGFVSERLLDVWLYTKGYDYKELPVQFMEDENWWKKGTNFLKRKIIGKK